MKNRKLVITAFVLVAAMLMAVGFAAMADDLYITGNAKITAKNAESAFAEDIYFTKAVISPDKGTAVIEADKKGEAKDKVLIAVDDNALKGQGDSVVCAVEISNVGDINAWVQLNSIVTSNENYFKVTTSWGNTNTMPLAAGETLDVVVTITCIKTPQTEVSTTFDLTYTALDYDPNTVAQG
jgi:hypothetical protein